MRGVLKSAAVTVALAAMVLRAIVPSGWMPSTQAAGRAPLMLCPGAGPALAAMPSMPGMDGTKPAPTRSHDQDRPAPCAFDMAGPLSPPAVAPAVAIPQAAAQSTVLAAMHAAPAPAPQFRSNAPRAPPASV